MQLTKLRAAPVRQPEVPPCAPAGEMGGGTASQLIRSVGLFLEKREQRTRLGVEGPAPCLSRPAPGLSRSCLNGGYRALRSAGVLMHTQAGLAKRTQTGRAMSCTTESNKRMKLTSASPSRVVARVAGGARAARAHARGRSQLIRRVGPT
jgi:hypothetical protein